MRAGGSQARCRTPVTMQARERVHGAFRAARMVQSLERGGLPLDGIGEAVRSGEVSFDFLGLSGYDRFSGLSGTTFLELHERTGIPLSLLQAMREAIGFA